MAARGGRARPTWMLQEFIAEPGETYLFPLLETVLMDEGKCRLVRWKRPAGATKYTDDSMVTEISRDDESENMQDVNVADLDALVGQDYSNLYYYYNGYGTGEAHLCKLLAFGKHAWHAQLIR